MIRPRAPSNVPPSRAVPALLGYILFAVGALIVLFTSMAIRASTAVCSPLPHCAQYAYQWFPGAPDMSCPCLVYIDGHPDEPFLSSADVAESSKELSLAAEAGFLRSIQLINRSLKDSVPHNVRRCTQLRILVRCVLDHLPHGWSATFTWLEHLQIISQGVDSALMWIPDDFFTQMMSLRTLSLVNHGLLASLPSFSAISHLEILHLSKTGLIRLPSFDSMVQLQVLALIDNPFLTPLPNLASVSRTLKDVYISTTALCCSGFLSEGVCNTADSICYSFDPSGMENTCYPDDAAETNTPDAFPLLTLDSRVLLEPFIKQNQVCNDDAKALLVGGSDVECEGVWYRKSGIDGICYSYDWVDLVCTADSLVKEMRRSEIASGIACDSAEEAWLGCTKERTKPSSKKPSSGVSAYRS